MRNRLLTVIALVLAAPAVGAAQEAAPAPPAPAPATPPAPAQSEPERSSYFILKAGYFGSSGDFEGNKFSGNGAWEAAIGYGRVLGLELGSGYMKTNASGLEVETVPVLLSLRLALPIAFVAPFIEAGGGAYYNKATIAGTSKTGWTAGWQAGLGLDFLLGPLLLGAEAQYMGFSQSFSDLGSVDLHRYAVLARAGLRF